MKQYFAVRDGFDWRLTGTKVEDGYNAWIAAGFSPNLNRHDADRLAEHGRVDRPSPARYFFAKREIIQFGRNRKYAERALEPLKEEATKARQLHHRADLQGAKDHVDMIVAHHLEQVEATEVAFKKVIENENGGTDIERYAEAVHRYADAVFYHRKSRWLFNRLKDLIAEQGHEQAIRNMLNGSWSNLSRLHAGNGGVTQEKHTAEHNAIIEFNAHLRGFDATLANQRKAAAQIASFEQAALDRREEVNSR